MRKKALDAMTPEAIRKLFEAAPIKTNKVMHEIIKLAQKQPFHSFGGPPMKTYQMWPQRDGLRNIIYLGAKVHRPDKVA